MNIINYLSVLENSETVNIIGLSLMGVAVLIAGVGFLMMVRSIRIENKLAKENQLTVATSQQNVSNLEVEQQFDQEVEQEVDSSQNERDNFY